MVSISKIAAAICCSFLLCFGLSTAARADSPVSNADKMKADQSDRRQGGQEPGEKQFTDKPDHSQAGKTIEGEVLRIEGDTYIIKGKDDKEVSLQINQSTEMSERTLNQGDVIEARVDDQNRVVSISSADRRNDHALESDETGAHSK